MKKKIKEMTFKEMLAWTENFSIFYMEDFVNAIKYSSISDKESLWQELNFSSSCLNSCLNKTHISHGFY